MAQSLVRSYSSDEILILGALVRVDLLSVGVGAGVGVDTGGSDVAGTGVCLARGVGEVVCALSLSWSSYPSFCPSMWSGSASAPPSPT